MRHIMNIINHWAMSLLALLPGWTKTEGYLFAKRGTGRDRKFDLSHTRHGKERVLFSPRRLKLESFPTPTASLESVRSTGVLEMHSALLGSRSRPEEVSDHLGPGRVPWLHW